MVLQNQHPQPLFPVQFWWISTTGKIHRQGGQSHRGHEDNIHLVPTLLLKFAQVGGTISKNISVKIASVIPNSQFLVVGRCSTTKVSLALLNQTSSMVHAYAVCHGGVAPSDGVKLEGNELVLHWKYSVLWSFILMESHKKRKKMVCVCININIYVYIYIYGI